MLDSTFAFVVLTPALALILPFCAWLAQSLPTVRFTAIGPLLYAVSAGILFAVLTTPGPLAHNMFIGRGTWIANHVTSLIGNPAATPHPAVHYPPLALMSQQLGAGLPLYVLLMVATLPMLRVLAHPAIRPEPAD